MPLDSDSYNYRPTDQPADRSSSASPRSSYRYSQRPQGAYPEDAPDAHHQHHLQKLTKEDLLVIQQCNRESFYQRCLPFGAMATGAIFLLGQQQLIKPTLWKYSAALAVAFLGGKLSYTSRCKEKFLNSNLNTPYVQFLKKQQQEKRGYGDLSEYPDQDYSQNLWGTATPAYDDQRSQTDTGFEFETETAREVDLNEKLREEEAQSQRSFGTTYDDLRKMNRATTGQRRPEPGPYSQTREPTPPFTQRPPY